MLLKIDFISKLKSIEIKYKRGNKDLLYHQVKIVEILINLIIKIQQKLNVKKIKNYVYFKKLQLMEDNL